MSLRVNIGCGRTPTPGWSNYDNSLSVRLAGFPRPVVTLLAHLRALHPTQVAFIDEARRSAIRYVEATRPLPFRDSSVDVIYTSHMLEHLDERGARGFLAEAYRVIRPAGALRIAVPDIRKIAEAYSVHHDADEFVRQTWLWRDAPRGIIGAIKAVAVGDRSHKWMYDGDSLRRRLNEVGFRTATVMPPGKTTIAGTDGLDLREREEESVYVEGIK